MSPSRLMIVSAHRPLLPRPSARSQFSILLSSSSLLLLLPSAPSPSLLFGTNKKALRTA
jgi:hypothetical protein